MPPTPCSVMIHFSKAAASELRRLHSKRRNPNTRMRLGVQPGGCSGFYYTITFDEVVKPDDIIYECNNLQVLVEATHLNYIAGTTLDYSEDLMGGAFRFNNPKSVQNCGCGNSFAVQE